LVFQDGFESGIASSWVANDQAPTLVPGCVGTQALSKALPGEWSPNEVQPGWLFHPLLYDTLLQYQVRARVWVDQGDWSDPRTVFIGFGWYQAGAADPFGHIGSANTQQESCPFQDLWSDMIPMPQGPPGAVFGLVVHGWTDLPTELFLDDVKVYTLPYKARFTGRVLLDGAYDPDTGTMRDDLRTQSLIPLTEPYTAMGYPQVAGGGGETTTQAVLDGTYPGGRVVDWVRLELRKQFDNTQIAATVQALLLQDGSVVSADPSLAPLFGVRPGVYWIVVRHRNHLGCMSASTRTLPYPGGGGIWFHDLSQGYPTYGTEAMKVVDGRTLLWAGNALADDRLKYTGPQNDRDAILQAIGGTVPTATITGYRVEDVTMNGEVKYTGSGNDRDMVLQNIGGLVPTSIRLEQLP
jgi:hypothetical protein